MGMISASIGTTDGPEELEGQHDDMASAEPRPFSHDSHFSVSPHSAYGYRLQEIDEVIVIGGNGRIVAVEHPAFGERRRRGAMPVATMPKRHDSLRFLWGPG